MKKTSNGFFKEAWDWIKSIIIALIIALLIRGFIFEPVEVNGNSMEDTLFNGQRLIVYKLGYSFSPPERGDIVVVKVQEGSARYLPLLEKVPVLKKIIPDLREIDYIKRVIGVPGDKIEIKDGKVFVNGVEIEEPYIKGSTYENGMVFPITVEQGKLFVMGDNRQNSHDSRQMGQISIDRIKGKAILRIWPLEDFGTVQ